MNKIEALTHGAVTLDDFLDTSPPKCLSFVTDCRGVVREVYPWTDIERHRPRSLGEQRMPPSDRDTDGDGWPSRPLQQALVTLQARASVNKCMDFTLDGRPVDARRLVIEANRVRRRYQLPLIAYPGVYTPE
ncbi:MAG: hypothetical protein KDA16_00480 [Phycisphaerales bacterium]|nr:hypothetical protein [Phycisphaerales bacterium]